MNGKAFGQGRRIYTDLDDTYIGNWLEDKRHGKGRYTWQDGDYYEGDFVQDKKHGQGIHVTSIGSRRV